jgi:hypothetical protein
LLVKHVLNKSHSPDKIAKPTLLESKAIFNNGEKKHPKVKQSGTFIDNEEIKTLNPQDPTYLKKRIAHLETQLRQKTDKTLLTGECKEIVIDYRRYETTKIEQF